MEHEMNILKQSIPYNDEYFKSNLRKKYLIYLMAKPIGTIIARMKHYITSSGGKIIIGRNSRENEQLTFQIARANDLWFHARNAQGAHVVLMSPDNNHDPGDIQHAANLAALHSKLKTKNVTYYG
jgi:predicted ribosome quality control (RQC) complex YloA/Tae2 family protein